MARDGSGTFNRTDGTRSGTTTWTKAKNAAVKIISTDHDTHDQDMANEITNSLAKDGQTVRTGNQDYGTKIITNYGANAKTLNFNEGTFTPTFQGLTDPTDVSYSTQSGSYTILGDIVFFDLICWGILTGAASGNFIISGLPQACANETSVSIGVRVGITGSDRLHAYISAGSQIITVAADSGAGTSILNFSAMASSCYINISGSYKIN